MQKKGFGKAIIIGVVSGVVAAAAAAYFIWEYAKHYACAICAQKQASATIATKPEPEPQRGTSVVKHERDNHYNTSDLEPLVTDMPTTMHEQSTISEDEPFKKSAPKKSVAPKQKSRRKRKRKKVMTEEDQPSAESSEQLQKISKPITIEPVIESPMQQSPIAEPTLDQSNPESAVLQPPSSRTLHVHNNIPPESLPVKHWTGTYTPTKLNIIINGEPFTIVGDHAIPKGTTKDIPCKDGCLKVEYLYEFMNGMRTGTDIITYLVSETAQDLHLRFSWDTAWHVELDGAERK